ATKAKSDSRVAIILASIGCEMTEGTTPCGDDAIVYPSLRLPPVRPILAPSLVRSLAPVCQIVDRKCRLPASYTWTETHTCSLFRGAVSKPRNRHTLKLVAMRQYICLSHDDGTPLVMGYAGRKFPSDCLAAGPPD